ncbi:MAG: amidase family protein [Candidatus Woesearchaeota archaeon]
MIKELIKDIKGESEIEKYFNLDQKSLNEFKNKFLSKLKEHENKNIFINLKKSESIKKAIDKKELIYPVKDNVCTKDLPTSAGSKILEDYNPMINAEVITNIGGYVLGKTNMDEFGFGGFGINSGYKTPKNAWDLDYSAGGSSSGSGSYSAIFPFITIAESTGGSISSPAAFNGVIGFTPTYGMISRFGLISYANSLDKIGFTGRYAKDIEIAYRLSIKEKDEKDPTNIKRNKNKKIKKIAIIKELCEVDDETHKNFRNTINKLKKEGYQFEEVSVPLIKYSISAYYILSTAEASTNLNRYCGLRFGKMGNWMKNYDDYFKEMRTKYLTDEAKRRIIIGTFTRMHGYKNKFYQKAQKIRTKMINEFNQMFKEYDAFINPTMPISAPKLDEISKLSAKETYKMDLCTVPSNLMGLPHISLPMKTNDMPNGIQITTSRYNDLSLFDFARDYEEVTEKKFVEEWFK